MRYIEIMRVSGWRANGQTRQCSKRNLKRKKHLNNALETPRLLENGGRLPEAEAWACAVVLGGPVEENLTRRKACWHNWYENYYLSK